MQKGDLLAEEIGRYWLMKENWILLTDASFAYTVLKADVNHQNKQKVCYVKFAEPVYVSFCFYDIDTLFLLFVSLIICRLCLRKRLMSPHFSTNLVISNSRYHWFCYLLQILYTDCGTLTILNGLVLSSTGTTLDSIATLGCNEGYSNNGDDTATCTATGWNQTANCIVKGRHQYF